MHLGKSLRVKFLFRQQKKDPFSVYRLRDRQSEAFEQIGHRRDRTQDRGGLIHRRLKIKPACPQEEPVGQRLRNAARRHHRKRDYECTNNVPQRSASTTEDRPKDTGDEPPN